MTGRERQATASKMSKPRAAAIVTFIFGVIGAGLGVLLGVLRVGLSNSNFFNYQTESTPVNYASSLPFMWVFAGLVWLAAGVVVVIVAQEFFRRRPWWSGVVMALWAAVATWFSAWVMLEG